MRERIIAEIKGHPLALFGDFRWLFAGRVVSAVGDKFFAIAIAWWVLSRCQENAKFHLGLVMAVNVIPVVAFGPVLGTLADRCDRRKVMLWADAVRAALVFTLVWFMASGGLTLPLLYALCFGVSAFGPLFESAVAGSVLRLTSREKLSQAVAADSSVSQVSGVIGSALGSVLMALIGVSGAFAFNAFSYLVSFAAVFFIKKDMSPEPRGELTFGAQFREGLVYIFANRPVLSLIAAFAAFNFFVGPILIIIPMLVKFTLRAGVTWLAVFETFFALGAALVSAALSFKKGYRGIYGWFFISVFLMGLSFLGLYFTQNRYVLCALLFVSGSALGLGNAVALTLFQHTVPEEMKGRFFSVLTTLCYAVLPVTFLVNGVLADVFSPGFSILLNSCAVLALSGAVLLLPRIEVKPGY